MYLFNNILQAKSSNLNFYLERPLDLLVCSRSCIALLIFFKFCAFSFAYFLPISAESLVLKDEAFRANW